MDKQEFIVTVKDKYLDCTRAYSRYLDDNDLGSMNVYRRFKHRFLNFIADNYYDPQPAQADSGLPSREAMSINGKLNDLYDRLFSLENSDEIDSLRKQLAASESRVAEAEGLLKMTRIKQLGYKDFDIINKEIISFLAATDQTSNTKQEPVETVRITTDQLELINKVDALQRENDELQKNLNDVNYKYRHIQGCLSIQSDQINQAQLEEHNNRIEELRKENDNLQSGLSAAAGILDRISTFYNRFYTLGGHQKEYPNERSPVPASILVDVKAFLTLYNL